MPKTKGKYVFVVLFVVSLLVTACSDSTTPSPPTSPPTAGGADQEGGKLRVLWNQGFFVEEDDVIRTIVSDWEKENGVEVDLTFLNQDDGLKNIEETLNVGNPPDVAFNWALNFSLTPRLAWEGQLADVSTVVEPAKDLYSPSALQSVDLMNHVTGKRSYYAVPIEQQTIHIFYRRDLLAQAGLKEEDIPQEWAPFWEFWKQAQDKLREQGNDKVYAIGLSMSAGATDTNFQFEQTLQAFGVRLINEEGQLQLKDPKVRQGIIDAFTWYTDFYKEGYVPPRAVDWLDPDNNSSLLNGETIMTPNPTLSIPASQKSDPEFYSEKLATLEYPHTPGGEPMAYLVSVKHAIIFEKSKNKELAKKFLADLIQPKNLALYVEGSQGRWFPVMPQQLDDPFWTDPADPHIPVAVKQFGADTYPFYQVLNPAHSEVQAQNVWGKGIRRILDGATPEQATDETIATIEKIFAEWE
jgi:multiple sugar transport system substrate-binding protein